MQSRTELRPFHGHIKRAEAVASNGGLARYRFIVEPYTAFLCLTQDSAIDQDMSVIDIAETILQSLEDQGTLNPQWRMDVADQSLFTKRSLTTQYQAQFQKCDLDLLTTPHTRRKSIWLNKAPRQER